MKKTVVIPAAGLGARLGDFTKNYSKAMWFLLTIPPAIGMAISIIPTIKYEITSKSHQEMLNVLIERHKEAE